MRSKHFIRVMVAAVVALAFFWFGYLRGQRDEKLAATRFNLISSLHLYSVAQQGDSEKLKQDLAFLVYAFTKEYTKSAGGAQEPADFQKQLDDARRISQQVETNLVVIK